MRILAFPLGIVYDGRTVNDGKVNLLWNRRQRSHVIPIRIPQRWAAAIVKMSFRLAGRP